MEITELLVDFEAYIQPRANRLLSGCSAWLIERAAEMVVDKVDLLANEVDCNCVYSINCSTTEL